MELLPRNKEEREKDILWFFDLALLLKVVNGSLEILGAVLVLLVPPSLVIKIAEFATSGEIGQDPDDIIATSIRDAAQAFAVHSHYLLALYLVLHGAIKVLLVLGIFAGKKIAYPLFMIALTVFGAYEAYRGFARHEILLQALAIFDFSLLILTAYEYRRRYPIHSSLRDTQGDYAGR
ncbi:MAG: DUF2127 domain-containing protein [Candidatus Pacebacteria bacterium]|nr:DUF2127 domain-containing protein [Candidatus Paceibacterota bacterium]